MRKLPKKLPTVPSKLQLRKKQPTIPTNLALPKVKPAGSFTTYRHSIRGALSDFLDKTPFKGVLDSADLVDVAASVVYHVEEGIRLYPEVIFCSRVTDLRRYASNSQFIQTGSETNVSLGIKTALKKLAPLTSRDWVIVIEVEAGRVRFGVFNPSPSPISVDFGASIEAESETEFPIIRVSRLCEDVVRFYSPSAGEALISFSPKDLTQQQLAPNASLLADAIFAGLQQTTVVASARTYLRRALEFSLQQCHGALICVVADASSLPPYLGNCIKLDPPINFQLLAEQFLQMDDNNEIKGRPFVYFDLVAGIISFDGVVVFSRTGTLLAYNCILDLTVHNQPQKALGASRRAAFEMLKNQVGALLSCAYYQSQDGPSEIHHV